MARRFAEIPDDEPIPISLAHNIVDKSSATIYRWVSRGLLKPVDTPDGMMTTPANVRQAEASITKGRPRAKR